MEYLRWGKKRIHPKYGTLHFLVVGASGSGKTTLINMMLKSVFSSQRNFRAMIYDPKQEIIPYLYHLNGSNSSNIKILNPFDRRSCAWNMAMDIDSPVSARQLATILVPDNNGGRAGESFFTDAVRDLLTTVVLTFINCVPNPNQWTFRDILLTMLYEPYLKFILSLNKTREGKDFPVVSRTKKAYLGDSSDATDSRTISNIRATINTVLSIYEPIAAVWEKSTRQPFFLVQWKSNGCNDVLVLGNDESSRVAIDALNRAVFKRATELFLTKNEISPGERETGENQTWFFLDEVREAGDIDGLSRLMTKGRSKGACIVLGFQDIDGMRDVYGDEVAHEICGQCNNIAILKLNSPSTAQWATELFGKRLADSRGKSSSLSSGGQGVQMSNDLGQEERPWVYTSDLLYLPNTSPQSGLRGFFRSPNTDPYEHSLKVDLNWATDIEDFLPKLPSQIPAQFSNYVPRNTSEYYLEPWNEEDWKRLGLNKITSSPIAYDATEHQQSTPSLSLKNVNRRP